MTTTTSRATPQEALLSNPAGLGDTLGQVRAEHGPLAELAFVVGVLGAVAAAPGDDSERVAAIRQVLALHRDVQKRDQHGLFSTCPDDCPRCPDTVAAMETEWQAAMQARGVHLVDVATLSPDERAAHARDAEHDVMAAEHAAAADPDPDDGRDLDGAR